MILVIIAAVALLGLAIVIMHLLGWNTVINWFENYFKNYFKNSNKINNPEAIAFTLKQKLEGGKCKVVQGIFNKQIGTIADGVEYHTEKLDDQLESYHKDDELVVYQ